MTAEDRLQELGISLAAPIAPVANYSPSVRSGNLLFISGHVSRRLGEVVTGKAGSEHDREAARELARLVAIDMLATAAAVLPSLDAVRRVVKVTGMVNSTDSFIDHSYVIDGASSLLVDVFADRGRHARSAFGVAQLPLGAAIELEAVLEIDGE